MLALALPAQGVIINSGDGSGNTTAPISDPGWANVGVAGQGTAVYLGDRWVITAAHVGVQYVQLGGNYYTPESGTIHQLLNPTGFGMSTYTDILMYRLTTDPGLPTLPIATVSPANGSAVMMIGDGLNRATNEVGWNVTASGGNATWTQVPLLAANTFGYQTLDTRTMRWGQNSVATAGDQITKSTSGDFISAATLFSSTSTLPSQGQATPGDSGGGIFTFTQGHWQLQGIVNETQSLTDQPASTVVFGNETLFSDLAQYRNQIEQIIHMVDPNVPWQNPVNRFDVDANGVVAPLDALAIINELNKNGPHALTTPVAPNAPPPYYDVAGANTVSPLDAILIIDQLNSQAAAAAALASNAVVVSGSPTPEPSAGLLGLLALGGWAAWARFGRLRLGRSAAGSPGAPR